MRKTGRMTAAALAVVMLVTGCGSGKGKSGDTYLKDLDLSKYVTLGDYTGLTVQVDAPESATEEEQASYANYQLSTLAGSPVTDRAAKSGDTANIDFAGRMADTDEYFDGGTSEGYDLVLGSGSFIPGFEDAVIGMEIGETKDIPLTFPENYGAENLAGQDVIFTVTLNALSAVTDESVLSEGIEGVSTVDDYVDYMKKQYADYVKEQYRSALETALRDKVEANAVFSTAPQGFLERMKKNYNEQMQILADAYSSAYGQTVSVAQVLSYAMSSAGYSGDEEGYISSTAIENTNNYLLVGAIAKEQGITVTDEELQAEIKSRQEESGAASVEEYLKDRDAEQIREQMLYDRVMDYLVANNSVAKE